MMKLATRGLLMLAFLLPLLAADITGKWTATFDTQIGDQKYTFDLKADGNKLNGKSISQWGEHTIEDGKVDGNQISFAETVEVQGTQMRIGYTGVIEEDEIKLTRKVGDFATERAVAKREK
jgi:hypothetical protein